MRLKPASTKASSILKAFASSTHEPSSRVPRASGATFSSDLPSLRFCTLATPDLTWASR